MNRGRPPLKTKKHTRLQAFLIANEARFQPRCNDKPVDLEEIKALAQIGCTLEDMAAVLRCSTNWITLQMDNNPAFALAMEEGRASMKMSLRRRQLEIALKGSVPMLIWLGKQVLGQSDKQEQNVKTEVSITVQRAMEELRALPRESLIEAQRLLEAPTINDLPSEVEKQDEKAPDGGGGPPV